MIRLLTFCAVVALVAGSGYPQYKQPSLYRLAMEACVKKQLAEYGNQNPETRNRLENRIFQKEEPQTDTLPSDVEGIKLYYLSVNDLAGSSSKTSQGCVPEQNRTASTCPRNGLRILREAPGARRSRRR